MSGLRHGTMNFVRPCVLIKKEEDKHRICESDEWFSVRIVDDLCPSHMSSSLCVAPRWVQTSQGKVLMLCSYAVLYVLLTILFRGGGGVCVCWGGGEGGGGDFIPETLTPWSYILCFDLLLNFSLSTNIERTRKQQQAPLAYRFKSTSDVDVVAHTLTTITN